MPALYGPGKAKNEFKTLEGFVRTFFKEYESTNSHAASYYEGGGFGSSSFGSGLSTEYRGGFKKFLSDIEVLASENDDSAESKMKPLNKEKSTSDLMRISVKKRQLYLYAKEHEKKLQR
ncbi:hypothetical protein L6452_43952 [Arctium lappa]|uniref:Uncharacterized protein n=1 Tax=Arctium lappa TaxID=4217 RepID=A0ACB8XEV8_ARCLA|nr:hypothetical protein L6452_43952 [Arctium lappa]